MMKNKKCKKIASIIFTIVLFISMNDVLGLKNPSAVYCQQMGYELTIEETELGQMNVCKFSETESCSAVEFLIGKCGEEYSYCSKNGYQLKTVSDPEKCISIPFECAVCVLQNGTEVEVTKLMGLSFEEGVCGDSKCVLGESHNNCPQDCPSGSFDVYCDGKKDGICDPDCRPEEDPDCIKKTSFLYLGIIFVAILVIVLILIKIYFYKKRDGLSVTNIEQNQPKIS